MRIYILILKMSADFVVKYGGSVCSELVGLGSSGASVHLCKQQNIFWENILLLSLLND